VSRPPEHFFPSIGFGDLNLSREFLLDELKTIGGQLAEISIDWAGQRANPEIVRWARSAKTSSRRFFGLRVIAAKT